jgi:hypothetical protein
MSEYITGSIVGFLCFLVGAKWQYYQDTKKMNNDTKVKLALALSAIVHNECENGVPHDIGRTILTEIEKHLT